MPTKRPEQIVHTGFQWNYTTFLNFAFLVVFAVLLWFARNRDRFGGGRSHATDPVCGMQVEIASAPATAVSNGVTHWFCSEHCRDRFTDEAGRSGGAPSPAGTQP